MRGKFSERDEDGNQMRKMDLQSDEVVGRVVSLKKLQGM